MSQESFRSRRERYQHPEVPSDDIPLPEETIESPPAPPVFPPQKSSKKRWLIGLAIILVLLLSGLIGYMLGQNKQTVSDAKSQKTVKPDAVKKQDTVVVSANPVLDKVIKPTTGEIWYKEPKILPTQGFVAAQEVEKVDYYEVGTRGKNTIILGILQWPLNESAELFERSSDGAVKHIARPSSQATYDPSIDYQSGTFVSTVSEDKTTHYDSLSYPKTLKLSSGEVINTDTASLGRRLNDETYKDVTVVPLNIFGSNKFVRLERRYIDTQLTAIHYVMQTPFQTEIAFNYFPIDTTFKNVDFSNGQQTDDGISAIVRGCGAGGGVSRADSVSSDQFSVIGKASNGEQLYGIKNPNASLVQKAYEEYVEFYKEDLAQTVLTKEEFIAQHAIVAYKTKDGEWLIFTRNSLSPSYGCAKPVVYLYPTVTQRVSVQVGADIKKSDPLYPNGGWVVTAQSNGVISYDGKNYTSLFWEGPGTGVYPAVTSGVVVRREKALETIKKQLKQQGLTTQEQADFMDYWADKIPRKPFIRLTWFDTAQLNELAPLKINPNPDTIKRIFLDMAGLDRMIKLSPQKLTSFERKGFTVVEWGGLSSQKLF